MPYNISHLSMHQPGQHVYFFDANIWLLILGVAPQPDKKQQKYIAFFQAVLRSDAIIILPATLVGEVVNRILYFKASRFAQKRGDRFDGNYFKKVYREQPQCKSEIQRIYDDFKIYAGSCSLIGDRFGQEDFGYDELLTTTGPILEFNDNYLLKLSIHHGAIVITDDGDFFVEDVPIYTLNNTLISRGKEKIAAC